MIIDYSQTKESIDISYVTDNGQIAIETIKFDDEVVYSERGEKYIRQFSNFVECEESDPNKNQFIRSYNNRPIKLEQSKRFTGHNVNYFLNYQLKEFFPDVYEKTSKLIIPKLYSVDIETDITDKYGYSNEEDVENPIRSISFTDENLRTILFIVKNQEHPTFNDIDKGYIRNILQESLGSYYNKYDFNFEIRTFETEIEMLSYFIVVTNKYFHTQIGWNYTKFDIRYLANRCVKLGLPWKGAAPTGKLSQLRIEINESNHINISVPSHRIFIDYMQLFKDSLVYGNLGKYNLDSIADLILGLHKVSYSGNLRLLYQEDYLRFVAYALVDTIIVMLIHKAVNLIGVEFFQSYYTGVPFLKLSQNSISEALIYNELQETNQFLLESEYTNNLPRKYEGGYVKAPTQKIVESLMGVDFGSLYPNTMITVGISPDSKIDVLRCGPDGFPDNEEDRRKWEIYKAKGYCLTPAGRVYAVNKDYLFTRIEKKLLAERKIFKNHMNGLYMEQLSQIEAEIKRRGLTIKH